jgi:hypothetical protein
LPVFISFGSWPFTGDYVKASPVGLAAACIRMMMNDRQQSDSSAQLPATFATISGPTDTGRFDKASALYTY